jgi:hypothetical protein
MVKKSAGAPQLVNSTYCAHYFAIQKQMVNCPPQGACVMTIGKFNPIALKSNISETTVWTTTLPQVAYWPVTQG